MLHLFYILYNLFICEPVKQNNQFVWPAADLFSCIYAYLNW